MKKIIRWTCHNQCSKAGHDCLNRSIKYLRTLYKDICEYYICSNEYFEQSNYYKDQGIKIIIQSEHLKSIPIPPFDTCWKFYPPRIDINAHELFLDNDLIIYKKSPTIDYFFDSDICIASAAHIRSFGQFDYLIDPLFKINTGIMGIPPGYDLGKKISTFLKLYSGSKGWIDHSDDQGTFAYLMLKYHAWKHVPLEEVAIVNHRVAFAPYELGSSGTHFVGLNCGEDSFYQRFLQEMTTPS